MKILKKILKKFIITKKEKILIPCLEGHLLSERTALITGSSSGIGFSIAENFLKNGARVIITGRNREKLLVAKKQLKKNTGVDNEKIIIGYLDITNFDTLEDEFNSILSSINVPIDIFVNNAGINVGSLFPDTDAKDFDTVMNTNVKGTYMFSQIVANYLIKNNIKGNILNINSSSSLRPAISPYILSKWCGRALTLGMAKKYLKYGITVNGIAPGSTATEMLQKNKDNDLFCDYTLTKRYIAPEEIANIATVLVSDIGKMIIGDTIYVTGGAGLLTYDDMSY